jgi:hypothetical protein
LLACAKNEFLATTHKRTGITNYKTDTCNILYYRNLKTEEGYKPLSKHFHFGNINRESSSWKYKCYLKNTKPTLRFYFNINTPAARAAVTGCTVEELPELLRYWNKEDDCGGNQILNRIDPILWVCKNPWKEIDFGITIDLSLQAILGIQKSKLGIYNKFWETK